MTAEPTYLELENYEISFSEPDETTPERAALLTFDLADLATVPDEPTQARVEPDGVVVGFGVTHRIRFTGLPADLAQALRGYPNLWVCGLRGTELELGAELALTHVP